MDTQGQSAACNETVILESFSTAKTLPSARSANDTTATFQGPGPLKGILAVASVPKVDSWLHDMSPRRCNNPPPAIRLDQPAVLPPTQAMKSTTSGHEPPLRGQPPTGPRSTYATVLAGKSRFIDANISVAVSGPGPQPLRGIPGFPGQQAPQSRAAPLGSRLQNGKIGAQT